jgi:RNA 3'-phosphate cyclase
MPEPFELIEIDGAQGEGGGQVLRSALSLSAVTGKGVHLYNIRAGRSKPGLMAQHLKAVDAAAAVCRADVQGAHLHSQEILFKPGELRTGRYRFEIGTAGATTLVLQTVFLPLSLAGAASTLGISGGTHVAWSPCLHYLTLHWLPYMHQAGFDAEISLEQAGFYPQGGGRISATLRPCTAIKPLQQTERGALLRISGVSAVANLDISIAERQKRQAMQRLQKLSWGNRSPDIHIRLEKFASPGKGTLLLLLAEFEGGRCCYYGLGALGKPAERVADEAVDALLAFIDTGAAIDLHLADQLLLPLSLASGASELSTEQVTQHLLTNAEIIRLFLPVKIDIHGSLGEPGLIHIQPAITQGSA